jgi:hypothetical protein
LTTIPYSDSPVQPSRRQSSPPNLPFAFLPSQLSLKVSPYQQSRPGFTCLVSPPEPTSVDASPLALNTPISKRSQAGVASSPGKGHPTSFLAFCFLLKKESFLLFFEETLLISRICHQILDYQNPGWTDVKMGL